MTKIHPTAVIAPKVNLGKDVEVGAYCVIEDNVSIGDKTKLHSHIVIAKNTQIGAGCNIYPFASIGLEPQDLKYNGEESRTIIGNNNIIRESVTIHRGTEGGNMETRTGNDCFFMACSHVAHDCDIKNNVILANGSLLAGHCTLGDYTFLGGNSTIAQFINIGAHAFICGSSGVTTDLPPFVIVFGTPAIWRGVNIIGLKRCGFLHKEIKEIRKLYDMFFKAEGTAKQRVKLLEKECSGRHIDEIIKFIEKNVESNNNILQTDKLQWKS